MRYWLLSLLITSVWLLGDSLPNRNNPSQDRTEELTNSYLDSLENLFKQVPQWLTTVYDKPSGGFYDNALMVKDAKYGPDLQSTQFAIHILDYGNILSKGFFSEVFKKGLEEFVKNRYDAGTGFYLDPPYRDELLNNERALARAQGMASQILEETGTTDKRLKRFDTGNTPERLRSLKQFKKWFHDQPWDRVWTAFDRIAMQASMIRRIPPERADSIVQYINDYAKGIQDDDGLWGKGQAMEIRFSGAAKYGTFCKRVGVSMPNPERIQKTVMEWFRHNKTLNFTELSGCPICIPRNALRLLFYVRPGISKEISKEDRLVLAKQTFGMLGFYHRQDGGFMKDENSTVIAPDDINLGKYHIPVSDMNGTNLAITARGALYDILDRTLPEIKNETHFN